LAAGLGERQIAEFVEHPTESLAALAQPAAPLYGIQNSGRGSIVIFGGGIPVIHTDRVIGAVGASAGTVQQDIAVAEAAVAAISV
jgi:uncharacterized protein GlcG (DUF336 family)